MFKIHTSRFFSKLLSSCSTCCSFAKTISFCTIKLVCLSVAKTSISLTNSSNTLEKNNSATEKENKNNQTVQQTTNNSVHQRLLNVQEN